MSWLRQAITTPNKTITTPNKTITLYHGTSQTELASLLTGGYIHNLWLTQNVHVAFSYAQDQAKENGDYAPVLVELKIPETALEQAARPDECMLEDPVPPEEIPTTKDKPQFEYMSDRWFKKHKLPTWKESLQVCQSIRFEGYLDPAWLTATRVQGPLTEDY